MRATRRSEPWSQVPEPLAALGDERVVQAAFVGRGERPVHVVASIAHPDLVTVDAIGTELLVLQRALHDLVRAGRGWLAQDAHVARPPLRPDRVLRVEPPRERIAVEARSG